MEEWKKGKIELNEENKTELESLKTQLSNLAKALDALLQESRVEMSKHKQLNKSKGKATTKAKALAKEGNDNELK